MMDGTDFSRFVIAPDNADAPPKTCVLQCGKLGAFGGFFARGYRAHDFALGRRNCQWFLREYFRLPTTNPVMQEGLSRPGVDSINLLERFRQPPPEVPTGAPDA